MPNRLYLEQYHLKAVSATYHINDDFLQRSALWMTIVSVITMMPFAVTNFWQGNYVMALGACVVTSIFAFNAWTINHYRRYHAIFALLVPVPIVIFLSAHSMLTKGFMGGLWCYPAICAFYFMLPERYAWCANLALLSVITPMVLKMFTVPLASRMVATLVLVSLISVIFIRMIHQQQARLRQQIITDPLTGLLNRTSLQETLEQAIAQSRRTDISMTIATLDIDYFKSINDTFGHDVGDQILREISTLLQQRMRRIDRVFRLGGEEFLVLFYGSDAENGLAIAEELRQGIEQLSLLVSRRITVSIGVAPLEINDDWTSWMKRSDEKLYVAKAHGRNQVVI